MRLSPIGDWPAKAAKAIIQPNTKLYRTISPRRYTGCCKDKSGQRRRGSSATTRRFAPWIAAASPEAYNWENA
jgi:hypothetical protein